MKTIATEQAPAAIGAYSQAVAHGDLLFISGQIPLTPGGELIHEPEAAIEQVFDNLTAICKAAGTNLHRTVKLGVFLTDLGDFDLLNQAMARHFSEPFPARAAIEVKALPKQARVEMDAVVSLTGAE